MYKIRESKKLRVFKGRSSKGIKGLELAQNDQIVSLSIIDNDKNIQKMEENLKMINLNLKQRRNLFFQLQKMDMEKKLLI